MPSIDVNLFLANFNSNSEVVLSKLSGSSLIEHPTRERDFKKIRNWRLSKPFIGLLPKLKKKYSVPGGLKMENVKV